MEAVGFVNAFVHSLIEQGEMSLVKLLRQRFLERIEEKAGFRRLLPLQTKDAVPATLHHQKKPPCLLDFKSLAIAEQMTLLDSQLFHRIELSEMLCWAQHQSETTSPNLVTFTEHFNKVSYWVRTRVIDQPDQKEREKYFWKFIKIMRVGGPQKNLELRRLGNFNSYLALLSALDSGPVRRLNWPSSIHDAISEHAGIMDSSQSFRNYRAALAQTPPPCLPYIGLILQDLTFIHVGNAADLQPDKCGGRHGLVNFGKRWQQFAILDSVRKFKSWSYEFERHEAIQTSFDDFQQYLGEDAIWEMSERLKPRQANNRNKK